MPDEPFTMTRHDRAATWLSRAWWLLMPPFAGLVLRLVSERTCAAPYELLPSLTSIPALAWLVAGLYLGAHAWLAAAVLFTIERGGSLVPTVAGIRRIWQGHLIQLTLALVLFAIEYGPVPFWQAVGQRVLRCGP
jgi:hypothetical protein